MKGKGFLRDGVHENRAVESPRDRMKIENDGRSWKPLGTVKVARSRVFAGLALLCGGTRLSRGKILVCP